MYKTSFLTRLRRRTTQVAVAFLIFRNAIPAFTQADTSNSAEASRSKSTSQSARLFEPIKPIPQSIALDQGKVVLGKKLFGDTRLSRDNTVSCATCHSLTKGGTDNREHSLGINGVESPVNAPTVFNSGFNFKQFWDGRADSLEHQVGGPLENPIEMGGSWKLVLERISEVPEYRLAFLQLYRDGVQQKNIENAIAEYERSLFTPNSRFDRYLRGEDSALNAGEKEGYRRFKALGCASCHQGVNVGGNMFERLGAVEDYFNARGKVTRADLGRYNVTGKESDKYVFKVPSLRNVALTAPYFHDGSVATLSEAVEKMALCQLGRTLSPTEVQSLVDFLQTLTGEYEGKPL